MSIQGILNNRDSQINSSDAQESTMLKRVFKRKWEKRNKKITLGENEHDCVRLSLWRNNYTIHIATIWCSQHDILMTLINPHPSQCHDSSVMRSLSDKLPLFDGWVLLFYVLPKNSSAGVTGCEGRHFK